MKYRAFFLFLCISVSASSQVSGYLGKRLMIGYSNYLAPALYGPGANADASSGTIGLNTTHCANLDFVIKTRTVLCLSLQKSNTGVVPSNLTEEIYDGFNTYNFVTYYYSPKPYKPMQLSSTNIALGFKFFQSGTIAPVGKYKKLELLFMMNKLTYSNTAFQYYDTYNSSAGLTSKKIGKGVYTYKTLAIAYTMGRSRVLFDRVVLDYGLRIGVVPEPIITFVLNDFFDDGSSSSTTLLNVGEHYRKDVKGRLFRSQLLNLHIGLSLLAL